MDRLQKLISQAGVASRRTAEELIVKRKVKVNGRIAKLGDKATFQDEIIVDGKKLMQQEDKVYFVLNKPDKVITSLKDPQGRTTINDIVDVPQRIFPVGRLDYDTTGVLLLTNDGELTHRLTHPSYEIIRVYRARLNNPLSAEELEELNGDDVLVNGKVSRQTVTKVDKKTYVVALHQGTYHHVKKLFETVEKEVIKLTRIEYGGITINGLSKGQFRRLSIKEVRWLKTLTKII